MALSTRQQAFVYRYLLHYNATRAAKEVGYSEQTANEQGARLLANVSIREEIAKHFAENKASMDESLSRSARRARGTMANLFKVSENGYATFDIQEAFRTGEIHNVKKIKPTRGGGFEITLYDAHAADELILRELGRSRNVEEALALELPDNDTTYRAPTTESDPGDTDTTDED